MATVAAGVLRQYEDFAASLGAPVRRWPERNDPGDFTARAPLEDCYDLIEASGCADFGLRFARAARSQQTAVDFLITTSATLGDAWRRAERFQRLWADGERLVYRIGADAVRVVFHPYGQPRPAHHHVAAALFYHHVVNAGAALGRPLPVRRVRFRGREQRADYDVFRVDVDFGAPVDELVLAPEVADLPMPHRHAGMCAFFERAAEQQLRALGTASCLADRVRTALRAGTRPVGLEALADRLRLRPRTLQRRLRQEGTSLRDLTDQIRRERALSLLDRDTPIPEISYLLGYSEPSAFHRAFRRWTGSSPSEFR